MYVNILKKDMKRKKTMNIILFLFTILAAMFVSSGLSNIVTVMNGTDYFLDKAGIGDYEMVVQNDGAEIEEILKNSKHVEDYRKEECLWLSKDEITVAGKAVEVKNNTLVVQKVQKSGIHYFTLDNKELTSVKKGEIYVTSGFLKKNKAKVGDRIRIQSHGTDKNYRIAGEIKDALLGSEMMGNTRMLISDKEYGDYNGTKELGPYAGRMFYINSDNVKALQQEFSGISGILFSGDRNLIKTSYVMDMIIAMIVLALSVCLVMVSFVLLKFVITFSISEEYREIGVMKAIGIKNFKIRSLFMMKYLGIAIFGGVAGFGFGIPFGNMLLRTVSQKMVLGNTVGIGLNLLGAVVVVLIMSGFAYLCTAKVKKATPVDAIRSGQTGERYKRKSAYSLKKAHFGNAAYMALNDVLSAPRRFAIIVFSFFLCSLFVFGVVEVADTMKSDTLISTFTKKCDVYITDSKLLKKDYLSPEGDEMLDRDFRDMEEDLEKMGMPGKVHMEVWYSYPITINGKKVSTLFQQNKKTKASEYEYTEGSAPENAGEIAITSAIAKEFDIAIGDRVVIDFGSEKKECIVSGTFQSMNQLGKVIRLHEDAPTEMKHASVLMAFQIDFDDHPDGAEVAKRIKKIQKFYDVEDVFDAAGFCSDCIGVAGTMDTVAKLLLLITCIVVVLVTVLMERSFIQDETNQIALLKALGFSNRFVLKWHVLRFLLVTLIAEGLAVLLTYPVTKLWTDPIWNMMGANHVEYCFNPVSLLVVYPGVILAISLLAVFFTGLYTYRIKSNSITNME